jgi:hypothetical protein
VLVSSRFGDDADELCGTCAECCTRSEEEHRIGDYRSGAMRTLDCVVESGRLAVRRLSWSGTSCARALSWRRPVRSVAWPQRATRGLAVVPHRLRCW